MNRTLFFALSLFQATQLTWAQNSPYSKPPEEFDRLLGGPRPLNERPVDISEISMGPFLENLLGVSSVMVRGQSGEVRSVFQGQQLEIQDSFLTGSAGSLRLAYEGGTHVLLGSDSYVTLKEVKNGIGFSPTPLIFLHRGAVRVLVEKPKSLSPRKHRFLVQTPFALIGVRGTDFVVTADESHSEVYTFTGTVDIARGNSPNDLQADSYAAVPSGQSSYIKNGSPVPPSPYNMKEYLLDFNMKYPLLQSLWDLAAKDAKTRKLAEKIEAARKVKTRAITVIRNANAQLNRSLKLSPQPRLKN